MRYIQRDLIKLFQEGEVEIIAHQCNCMGIMGMGFAKQLADNYPQINLKTMSTKQAVELFGTNEYFETEHGIIVNMYAQYTTGHCSNSGIDCFRIRTAALKQCLLDLNNKYPNHIIGLPLIASGLAADKERKKDLSDFTYFEKYIREIVDSHLFDMDVIISYL